MNHLQRLTIAAAEELVGRVWQPTVPTGGRVAESLPRDAEAAPGPGQALGDLARALVRAALALDGAEFSPPELARELERAARREIMAVREVPAALGERLLGQLPFLLDLPRLAGLCGRGLALDPAAVASLEDGRAVVGGRAPEFARVLADLELAAGTDFPVLLEGESGTGKEVMARLLHQKSQRRHGPLVALHCASLSAGLLESELFGHQKGAFTGALHANPGHIRRAQGGTLFLDEINETDTALQVKLLRVLQEKTVLPVGGERPVAVDFRLVTASGQDLAELVAQGQFHPALYYRLNVVPLALPPLRRRREDLPTLVDHFLAEACGLAGRRRHLSPQARQRLCQHNWPGNVRQLKHLMQRLVALSRSEEIGLDDLPAEVLGPPLDELQEAYARRLEGLAEVPARRVGDLAVFLAENLGAEAANRDLRDMLGCSDSTAKNLLRALDQAGLAQASGERGGRRYRILPPLAGDGR